MPLFRQFLILFFVFLVSIQARAESGGGASSPSPYLNMRPPFVLNVVENEEVHHLELSLSFIPIDGTVAPLIKEHEPAIRHAIVILISGRQVSEISTSQLKTKLRDEITQEVNRVLLENANKEDAIKRTLFTGFLIQ
jgi:flagellar FliL protein